jgi:hypothetical protein
MTLARLLVALHVEQPAPNREAIRQRWAKGEFRGACPVAAKRYVEFRFRGAAGQ